MTIRSCFHFAPALAALMVAYCFPASAQQASPFATGLMSPSKIIMTPGGKILVTECGQTPNSGRISIVDSTGARTTLIDGLPSGLAAPNMDADGENGLAIEGRTLYIAVGEGDSHSNGPSQGQLVPNPAGPSSPIFSSIVSMTFSGDIDKVSGGFSLKAQDPFTLLDGLTVALTNSAGDKANLQLVSAFRDIPDPKTIYRNSHPYGLALLPSQPRSIFMVDAGMNTVVQVNMNNGRATLVYRFPPTPNPLPGPPVSEAVPTSVRPYGTHLLVTLLSGAPFAPGASRVMDVDPVSGKVAFLIPFVSSAIDVLWQAIAGGTTQYYVLEYSVALSATPPGQGQLLVFSTNGTNGVLAKNLNGPSSMVLDPATGNIYITSRTDGAILLVHTR